MKLLIDIYDKARSSIQVNGLITDSFSCNIGVGLGCPLSCSILFILYTHDLLEKKKRFIIE